MQNKLKENGSVYVLKIDIKKYFYNINHSVLLKMLKKYISSSMLSNFIVNIINQTNNDYVNNNINYLKNKIIQDLNYKSISLKEKEELIKKIYEIPLYDNGKGLSIGNVCSQILAVFYLNEFDHYMKEKIKCRCYLRYMDDIVILSNSKSFLKDVFYLANDKLKEYKLTINPKSNIYKLNNSFTFLGRTYYLKNNILLYRCRSTTYKSIMKKLNYLRNNDFKSYYLSKISYKGYLNKNIYSLKEEFDFLSNKYNNVIVKDFIYEVGYVIRSNVSDDVINEVLDNIGISVINIFNIKRFIKYFESNNIKYIYLEKTKIVFKYDC